MTTSSLHSPAPHRLHPLAILAIGIVIGYLAFGTSPVFKGQIGQDIAPIASEDWHGNVRRSDPTQ